MATQISRNEASVMTSLLELRAIEEQRIADERAAVEQAREAERDAALAAEAAKVAAVDARVRAEREERIRIEEARVAAEREARLRVEAAEAAERARHVAALEQQRFAEETALRREAVAKTRPTWMLAVTALAVCAGLGLGWYALASERDARVAEAAKARADAVAVQARKDADETRAHIDQLQKDLGALDESIEKQSQRLRSRKDKADLDAAQREMARLAQARADQQRRIDEARHKQWEKDRVAPIDVSKCVNTAVGCLDHH